MNVSLGLTAAASATNTAAAMPPAQLPDNFCFSLVPPELERADWTESAGTPVDTAMTLTDIITPDLAPLPDTLLAMIAGSAPVPPMPVAANIAVPPEAPPPAPTSVNSIPVLPSEKPAAAAAENSVSPEITTAISAEIPFDLPDLSAPPTATPPVFATPQVQPAHTASAVTAPPIATPVSDAQWPEAVAESIVWSAGQQLQEAVIQLTPEDMGPLEIHIRIEDDITHVQFQAAHALTREALQNALPQLAPLLAQQGLKLGDAQVGSQTPQGSGRHPSKPGQEKSERSETASVTPLRVRGRRGLVDDYV